MTSITRVAPGVLFIITDFKLTIKVKGKRYEN